MLGMECSSPWKTSAYCWLQVVLTICLIPIWKLESCQKFRNSRKHHQHFCSSRWAEVSSTASRVDHDKYWKQRLSFQEEIWECDVIYPKFFPLGCRVVRFSAIFSLVALAKPNQTSACLEEVTITYFHSPLVFCNPKVKFLLWTNLQYSYIFEQFALENLYNGCLPMDHEKHLVTLSVKHKRNSYRFDDTFLRDLLI